MSLGREVHSHFITKYLTTPASRYIDCTLAPFLPTFPSYLKDSSDLIRQLSSFSIVPGSYLMTADVTSLYTNIPIKDLYCGY